MRRRPSTCFPEARPSTTPNTPKHSAYPGTRSSSSPKRRTQPKTSNTRATAYTSNRSSLSVTLISRPYQQRRAYATFRKIWPEPAVNCQSQPIPLTAYIDQIGEPDRVLNMLVGDTQRITRYAHQGVAIAQPLPDDVHAAYNRLVTRGYTNRLI